MTSEDLHPTIKEFVIKYLQDQPDDISLEEIQEFLFLKQQILRGQSDLREENHTHNNRLKRSLKNGINNLSQAALDDLEEIYKYIARDSSANAQMIIDRIIEKTDLLTNFPNLGKRYLEPDDPRVRIIFFRNFQIIYQLIDDNIEIVRVIHGRRSFKLEL